jgi:hypothetical protein
MAQPNGNKIAAAHRSPRKATRVTLTIFSSIRFVEEFPHKLGCDYYSARCWNYLETTADDFSACFSFTSVS